MRIFVEVRAKAGHRFKSDVGRTALTVGGVKVVRLLISLVNESERTASEFYAELERLLQTQVPLSELPPEIRPDTITLDGTTYVL
jgi:hypothetical protein